MATYSKVLSGGGGQYRLDLVVNQSSQSVANNTSTVSWSLTIYKTSGNGYSSNYTSTWSVNIGGQTQSGSITSYSFVGVTSKALGSGSFTISHNSDGTKSISASGTFNDGNNAAIGSGTASGTLALTTIARASSLGTVTGNTIGSSISVDIDRKSTSFTHTVVFAFGTYSQTLTGQTTSASFTVPTSWATAVPSSTSGTGSITLTTFSGTTQIGSAATKSFTLNVPSTMVPSLTSITAAEDGTTYGGYVQNRNKVKLTISGAAGVQGSTIQSYSISGNSQSSSSATASFTPTSSGDITFTGTVTDSRGRTASKTVTINVKPNTNSTLADISSVELGQSISASITKAHSSFTHKFIYQKTNGTQVTMKDTTSDTTASYTTAVSDSSLLPNNTSGTAKVLLETYFGSLKIGTVEKSFTVSVPSSVVPTISSVVASEAIAAISTKIGKYVKGASQVKIVVSASGTEGSTISSYSITGQNLTATTSTATSNTLTAAGDLTYTAKVVDSRGRTATKTTTINVLDYSSPILTNIKAFRADSSGTSAWNGTYGRITFNTAASSLMNSTQKNGLYSSVYIKPVGNDWPTTATKSYSNAASIAVNPADTHSGLAVTQGYDIKIELQDEISKILGTKTTWVGVISSGTVALDIGETNVGVGKLYEAGRGSIDAAQGVYQNNGEAVLSKDMLLGANTDLDDIRTPGMYYCPANATVATMTNSPTTQAFSLFVERHAGAKQTLTTYNNNSSTKMWYRNFYSGTWSAWFPLLTSASILDAVYPVGSIYISAASTSPATLFGGTWAVFGAGRSLVSVNSNDTDYNAAEKTGGAKTNTIAVGNLPSHTHSFSGTTTENGAHTHTTSGTAASAGAHTHTTSGTAASAGAHTHNAWSRSVYAGGDTYSGVTFQNGASWQANAIQSAGAHTHTTSGTAASAGAHTHTTSGTAASAGAHTHTFSGTTGATGSGTALDTRDPYITVYMWKRTA